MKKSGMKRLLSMALAACLVLGLLPAMAFAAEESVAMIKRTGVGYASIRAAVEAAQDGDTVVVVKDHEINCADNPNELRSGYFSLINVNGKSVTIDLNGKSLTGTVNFSNGKFILFSSLKCKNINFLF